jgi:hypothetical protein
MEKPMSEEEYRAHPALNISRLELISQSPLHYKIGMKDETEAMRMGTIFHMAILEPEKFKRLVVTEPVFEAPTKAGKMSTQSGEAREMRNAWREEHKDAMILTEPDYNNLLGMIKSLKRESELEPEDDCISMREIFSLEHNELPVFNTLFGRECKGKLDTCGMSKFGNTIVDFKKIGRLGGASEEEFSREVFNRNYDAKAWFYLKLFNAQKFYWVAVEEKPIHSAFPDHSVGIYDAEDFLEMGEKKVTMWERKLAECEKTGHWHSYASRSKRLLPKEWSKRLLEEQTW